MSDTNVEGLHAHVRMVRWPAEARLLDDVRRRGVPRLVLVDDDGASPPETWDEVEDWIRLPATDGDLRHRIETLARRARSGPGPRPTLDTDGVLVAGGQVVPLPPIESRLMAVLVDRYRAVVTRDALAEAGWPGGDPRNNALDVHLVRLRRRVAPLGLRVCTVRRRGYLLDAIVDDE